MDGHMQATERARARCGDNGYSVVPGIVDARLVVGRRDWWFSRRALTLASVRLRRVDASVVEIAKQASAQKLAHA